MDVPSYPGEVTGKEKGHDSNKGLKLPVLVQIKEFQFHEFFNFERFYGITQRLHNK